MTNVSDVNGNTVVEYTYDSEGRRVEVTDAQGKRDVVVAPTTGGLDSPFLIVKENEVEAAFAYAGDMPLARVDEAGNPVYYLTDAMGSVIGLVDGNGQEVAEFRYDSFGNLQTPEALSEGLGGDFRFQGQWLESNTDLYHFRARYYDPETGRFVSRDPVEVIETVPESSNPYQFVYNNPLVYSDPTGEIPLGDLLASIHVRKILEGIRNYSAQQAKEYLLDRAKGVAGDVLVSVMKQLVPFTEFQNVINMGRTMDAGTEFESVLRGAICSVIGESFQQFTQHLWLQPRISSKGKPLDDGWACGSQFPENENQWFFTEELYGKRPDFIIKDGGPRTTDKKPKAFLIGDVKLAGKTVLGNRSQFKAIMEYASFENGRQYHPTALYVTLYRPTQAEFARIKRLSSSYGVFAAIAPILSRTR
ncbi:RHS repeat-associated core domain-containing protein [Baaleninema simplex]|uniref:RHS repeat-associated core domain-containing protein n=1 Tax=Baaleninema simplex TaxID=2862350 RepID=UPI001FE0B56D